MKSIFSLVIFLGIFIVGCQQAPTTSVATPSPKPTTVIVEAPVLGTLPQQTPAPAEDRTVEVKLERKDNTGEATLQYSAYTKDVQLGKGNIEGNGNATIIKIPKDKRDQEFTISFTFSLKKDNAETSRAFLGIPISKDMKSIVFTFQKESDGSITAKYTIDGKGNKNTIEIK